MSNGDCCQLVCNCYSCEAEIPFYWLLDEVTGGNGSEVYYIVAGTGLLAHVLVSKYAKHLPLYGQSEIYRRRVPGSSAIGSVAHPDETS